MAIQTVSSGFYIPQLPMLSVGNTIQLRNMLLSAADEEAAGVFRAPKTGTINKVGFLTGVVTTGATVDVRLETVSLVNGDPTDTLLGTNSNGSQVIGDGDDDTWFLTTLTTGVAVTKGDLLAVTIVNPTASPGTMNITRMRYAEMAFPYSDLFTGTWAKFGAELPNFALEYSDGSYANCPGVSAFSAVSDITFNNTSTPDERGLRFKLPFDLEMTGFWLDVDLDGAAEIVLYDNDDSVLESLPLDPNVRASVGKTRLLVLFAGVQTLTKNVFRRLVYKPTSATDIVVTEADVDTVATMNSLDGGQDFHHTQRTDAGAWTDTTTKRPLMGLIHSGFNDGADGIATVPEGSTHIELVI